jgi:anthranilate synthase/aminodeoxychorismate synthase-like glutamine amidotransferase
VLLLIDNYDSFTYNLFQLLGKLKIRVEVFRNDKITLRRAQRLKPKYLMISPGPKRPEDAGISNQLIKYFAGKIPILGVCLGHQCIAYIFGGKIVKARAPMHGKTSLIYHDNKTIYKGLSNPLVAMRYHSLVVLPENTKGSNGLVKKFEISARTQDDEIMGLRMKDYPVEGVQFHPESYLTPEGEHLVSNFIKLRS